MSILQPADPEIAAGSRPLDRYLTLYLSPVTIEGETLRFDLSNYLSKVTKEMLQMRLRKTAQALDAGLELIPANVSSSGTKLLVDSAALLRSNARVRGRLQEGPDGGLAYLRRIIDARQRLDAAAAEFARQLSGRRLPTDASLLEYLDASSVDQALGSLKFCLPADVRTRLSSWFAEDGLLNALLSPDLPSMWLKLHRRELFLALLRLRAPAETYHHRLRAYQRDFGYLLAEDVDFELHESIEAIDRRLARLGGGQAALASAQRHVRSALALDQARKARARQIFAEKLKATTADEEPARLVALVLLLRAVAQHEDQNRQGKMRLLRDLRDAARRANLKIAQIGLSELAAALPEAERSDDPIDRYR